MRYLIAAAVAFGIGAGSLASMAADSISISQKGRVFSPAQLEAKAGTAVVFRNDDTIPHNISVKTPGGKTENSGAQRPGQDYTLALAEAGTYQVNCLIHPKMTMAIEVK